MLEINGIEIDRAPSREIAELVPEAIKKSEMSGFDAAFLCGLLERYRPRKIVEVGVSSGGTTAVVLQCMEDLGYDYEMYSVELREIVHYETNKRAGYLATEAAEKLGVNNWTLLTGGVLPDFVDQIGDGIDFLLLDTTHRLPGEVLEFLVAYPHLAEHAVVCMHDIRQNFKRWTATTSIATNVLFASVVAEKILCEDEKRSHGYPNIGAFRINEDTGRYICNVALALMPNWGLAMDAEHLDSYMRSIEASYDPEVVWVVRHAAALNADRLASEPGWAKALWEVITRISKKTDKTSK